MIEIFYRDKLGNRIFQYCLGRILAETHNCNLKCSPLPYFKNAIPIVDKRIIKTPTVSLKKHNIDFPTALSTPAHYVLSGWFQRYEYYKNHKKEIKKWLEIEPNRDLNITKDDLVIHVRLKDMDNINRSFAERSLEKYQVTGRRFIVTDDPDDSIAINLIKKYNLIRYHKSEIDDFTFIKAFNNIILGCSTYSWWAAFLSEAEIIVYPKTGYFNVARTNFWVDDESRYKLLI